MKFNLILATTYLALGATLSWILKPGATPATTVIENSGRQLSVSRSQRQPREGNNAYQIPRSSRNLESSEKRDPIKSREFSNKVEAEALTNFAKLLPLDLTVEQRASAYEVLYAKAETTIVENRFPGSPHGPSSMISEAKEEIEVQMELLAPILNETQLEQYRESLEYDTDVFLMRAISGYPDHFDSLEGE